MKCLITGASGFLGGHLVASRLREGDQIVTLARGRHAIEGVTTEQADILDKKAVHDAVSRVKPDLVFHLAAQSLPSLAWRDPEQTFNVNVVGTLHLLDALRASVPLCRVIVFGSSAEYAPDARTNASIREDHPLSPSSPYGLSKIAAYHLCLLYRSAHAMNVSVVRPFFVIGPKKTGDVTSDFSRAIVRVERGTRDHIEVGNLDAIRDFVDVRDAVQAFSLIAERSAPGVAYNVCSGAPTRLRDLLDTLISRAKVPIVVKPSPTAMRPLDEPIRVGDPTRMAALGWQARTPLADSLAEILDYWRARGPD